MDKISCKRMERLSQLEVDMGGFCKQSKLRGQIFEAWKRLRSLQQNSNTNKIEMMQISIYFLPLTINKRT